MWNNMRRHALTARRGVLLRTVVLTLLVILPVGRTAWGQVQLTEKVERVQVPVYEDNLDDAKSRAIALGQRTAVLGLLRDMVAKEWITLYDKELRQQILRRLDRYIISYRVQQLEPSMDRTRYFAMLSVQINRAQLGEDLHALSLPLLTDPVVPVSVFYPADDPVLSQPALRGEILGSVTARLKLLNLALKRFQPIPAPAAVVLENPAGDPASKARLLSRDTATEILFLSFAHLTAESSEGSPVPSLTAKAFLYARVSGILLGQFEVVGHDAALGLSLQSEEARQAVLTRVVDPLVGQMLPSTIKSGMALIEGSPPLRLRVMGITSIEDEEAFEHAFFRRNSPFEKFSVYAFEGDAITYQGPYAGDRSALEEQLPGKDVGAFRIRNVYWFNDVLELDVERRTFPERPEMKLFPREVRPMAVQRTIEDYLTRYPDLEVEDPAYAETEDNGWLNRANPLPFNVTIYGYVDARSDADFFIGEALTSGEEVVLIWHRISRTHLTPAIRIYDETGVPVKTFYPRSWMRYSYKIPPGQHRFYVEIGDRFGHLKVDTGGYLNYSYLFKVKRQVPWGPPNLPTQ